MLELPPLDLIYRALTVTGLQIALLGAILLFVSLLAGMLIRRADSISALSKFSDRTDAVRRSFNKRLIFLFVFFTFIILIGNGYLLHQRVDLLEQGRARLLGLGSEYWLALGIKLAKVIGIFIGAGLLVLWTGKILRGLMQRAQAYKNIKANDASIRVFFLSLDTIQRVSIWLLAAFYAVKMLPFPIGAADMLLLALKVYLIVALGLLALKGVAAIVQSLDELVARSREPEKLLGLYERLRGQMPLMRRCLEATIYVVVASLVMAQMDFIASLASWGPPLVESIGIFFVVRVVVEISNLIVDKVMVEGKELDDAERKGLDTIVPVFKSMLSFAIYFVGFALILRALGINPLPLLAGAGVVGIVLGLGAQPLINDVVSGLFILFERLFLVGDFVETGGARGIVESVQLRTTRVRDPDGQLHILRNGQLGGVINYSKTYTNAIVEVGIAYDSDIDHVYRVLSAAGEELKANNDEVLSSTVVQGIDNFGESEMTIRTVTRVKPGMHRPIAREYRKLIKAAFDREGIEIPFARRVIIFQNESAEMVERGESQAGG